jgi:shikimate kinase
MPGAGKSTVGVILAKQLSMDFVDTDLLIQRRVGSDLQSIVNGQGYLALRAIEEEVILSLSVHHTVIATGGSAVYSSRAMGHLRSGGQCIYLELSIQGLIKRIYNYETRGIAAPPGTTLQSLFDERTKLYREYGDLTIDCEAKPVEEVVAEIAGKLQGSKGRI